MSGGNTETEEGFWTKMQKKRKKGKDHGELPPKSSIKRWLVTTNHKDVGILYILTSLFFLIFGGMLALLIRLQLWTPGSAPLSSFSFNQAVTGHGLLMVFFFITPLATGFANYVFPLQIGAKDLAFPRLNALSYWLYLFSGLLFAVSFFQGGTFDTGWTMYAPMTIPMFTPQVGGTTTILALTLFSVSVTIGSVNFLTTAHRLKAEGMRIRDMPFYSWTWYITAWMMLFAFAALLAALILLTADRILLTNYYTSEVGALLWDHLFWFFGHPEVYIVFFPGLGIIAETFQTFSKKRIVGRKWFMIATVVVAFLSFFVWMHHMFLTSINLEIKTLFMATTIAISLPFDLITFALIYTLAKGKIQFTTPFLFSLGALIVFIIGGITGVFLGAVALDYQFRGTYWVVGHFHYVMVSAATALIAGLFYWFPKITGKMYNETLGKITFGLYFVGFNLLYFPMHIYWEVPRRVFEYAPKYIPWMQISTVGGFLLGFSVLLVFLNLLYSLRLGEDAGEDPWKGYTTEWAISSPPTLENYPGTPSFKGGSLNFLETEGGKPETDGGDKNKKNIQKNDG